MRLEHGVWGVLGDNGLTSEVRALRSDFGAFVRSEQQRRDDEAKDQRSRSRAINAAAVSSVIALIGVIVTLVVVLTTVA